MSAPRSRRQTFDLTPEQAYDLVLAALDVVGGVSKGVHERIARQADGGHGAGSNPTVPAARIVRLRRVLDEIRPGFTDRVIS